MKAIVALQVLAKNDATPASEIRAHVAENAAELADDFGLDVDGVLAKLEAFDDAALARKTLASIKVARKRLSTARASDRLEAAQKAADAIGAAAAMRPDGSADVDLGALLEALSTRDDRFVFELGPFSSTVPMAPLFALRADTAKSWRNGAWAFVDGRGLHVRWGRAGRLDLGFPTLAAPSDGDAIVVNVAASAAKEAA